MAKVSIIMGIYNCAATLPEAIDSILAQTFSDWQLVLCDDGSKDSTYTVAESYQEKFPNKIVLLQNERNMGLNHTLNRCLQIANGEYVARMDGDGSAMICGCIKKSDRQKFHMIKKRCEQSLGKKIFLRTARTNIKSM